MDANTTLLMNYAIAFFLGILVIWWFLRSFLVAWFVVRRSGGNKILVHVANPLTDYYKSGHINNGFLYYRARYRKDNPKPDRMLYVGDVRQFSYRNFGVNCIDVDDEKNVIWSRYNKPCERCGHDVSNYSTTPSHNAEAEDEALKTALIKPDTSDALFTNRVFQIIVIGGFLLLIVGFVVLYRANGIADQHIKAVYDLAVQNNALLMNATGLP